MSFRTRLLPVIEKLRGKIPGALDLRVYRVTVRVRTWTGARPGIGTPTDVDYVLQNAGFNVKVTMLSTKDVVASSGRYTAGDFRIGPFSPPYTTQGPNTTDPGLLGVLAALGLPFIPPVASPSTVPAGVQLVQVDPPRSPAGTARELFFLLEGPGLPTEGAWCRRVEANTFSNFRSELIVRRTGERP